MAGYHRSKMVSIACIFTCVLICCMPEVGPCLPSTADLVVGSRVLRIRTESLVNNQDGGGPGTILSLLNDSKGEQYAEVRWDMTSLTLMHKLLSDESGRIIHFEPHCFGMDEDNSTPATPTEWSGNSVLPSCGVTGSSLALLLLKGVRVMKETTDVIHETEVLSGTLVSPLFSTGTINVLWDRNGSVTEEKVDMASWATALSLHPSECASVGLSGLVCLAMWGQQFHLNINQRIEWIHENSEVVSLQGQLQNPGQLNYVHVSNDACTIKVWTTTGNANFWRKSSIGKPMKNYKSYAVYPITVASDAEQVKIKLTCPPLVKTYVSISGSELTIMDGRKTASLGLPELKETAECDEYGLKQMSPYFLTDGLDVFVCADTLMSKHGSRCIQQSSSMGWKVLPEGRCDTIRFMSLDGDRVLICFRKDLASAVLAKDGRSWLSLSPVMIYQLGEFPAYTKTNVTPVASHRSIDDDGTSQNLSLQVNSTHIIATTRQSEDVQGILKYRTGEEIVTTVSNVENRAVTMYTGNIADLKQSDAWIWDVSENTDREKVTTRGVPDQVPTTNEVTTSPSLSSGTTNTAITFQVTIPKPKGFWMLDRQNQGKDLSGYGNDIFLHQTKNAVGPYGAEGGSMEFEGTSGSYGTITNNGALDVAVDMTWMVWFYDLSTGQGPLFIYAPSIGGTHWSTIFFDCCTVESSFHPVFTKRGSTVRYPGTGTIPSTLGLDDSAWIHLAVTFNNTAGKVYVYRNGILDTRFTQSFTGGDGIDTAGDISIGKVMYKSDDRYLNARMACMQLYGETLSQEQILAAMEKCKTKPVEKQPTRYAVEATSCSVNEYLTTPNTLTPRMTAFTICYWLRVYKHTSNPHVFMVWNSGVTNALIMVVKDASYTLIINSATANLAVDGYSTVDGNWHRECWVWDSDTGIYAMYHLENSGVWQKAGEVTDFKKGATIEEGYLTLLQDQDSMLGGFQSNACFYGIMAGMEWWSYAKSSADIDALGCLERGNVWSMTAATVKAVGSFDGQFELAVCCRGLRKSSTPASKRDPSISQGTYHITKGKKSASLPDSTTANVTAEECIQSCLGTESCDTVNYVPSVRTCQLNSDGGNGVSGVTEDASSDYYTEWYQMTETESTLCPSLT